ncbi:DUF2017 domain-containing protein [Corynebacterium otitidis]|uniref:Uncharacterized protein n=1 Tax=Corynebacterium otitidis ATCC 51513 TaxID=883169 RepID=I7IWC1_9CORY|nr:DUF2017 domain-containing protein [Corynebacterium otitidis]EJZ82501.1 hypothetical protein HMPREF9719_00564 [Corynebacterium otitidis ATCC 51513]KKO83917.1 hypothetical protein AAV33_03935 [Corynebacterium otitidis]CCI82778.1 hypothetical protein BN46_0019 [Corynebacterium otitidis ATCC 51513]
MKPWTRSKRFARAVRYQTTLEPMEREVLGNLASGVAEALIARVQSAPKDELSEITGINSGHQEPPEDPALKRLLPDFEREGDEEFDGDNGLLRSLHETDICRGKIENLQVVSEHLGPTGGVNVTLSEEDAHRWLAALNDLRLYVAAGAGLDLTGMDVEAIDAAEESETLVEWLAYNQDSLLQALMGSN